jgi:fructosamine-3-kinase
MENSAILSEVERILSTHFQDQTEVKSLETKGGGSINSAATARTDKGNFFVKWNSLNSHTGMFEAEMKGLQLLSSAGVIKVPSPLGTGHTPEHTLIVMELLESGDTEFDFWEVFGSSMAHLHRNTHTNFGLDHHNFVGSLPQTNTFCKTWTEFFITNRIEPQLKRAIDQGKADAALHNKFDHLFGRLDEIFPHEAPALLHGDLWGGNFMCTISGQPAIYDPAVYYGHREMDLAMSKLFGGFDYEFYEAYHTEFPLEKDWEKRSDICNLYPLLVHVNLFMGSYIQSVKNILSRY